MNDIVVKPPVTAVSTFSDAQAWELSQRKAKALAESDLVPQQYKGKVANCLVALEVAERTGASIMAVVQNLNVIHGKPSWSSTFIIGAINSCGKFEPLRFKLEGEGDKRVCTAWTKDRSGEVLEGPPASIAMAKAEGWIDKNGSKWKTMPELMLRYRAAAFFGRLYAPEILLGMRTEDEAADIIDVTPERVETIQNDLGDLNAKIKKKKSAPVETPAQTVETTAAPNEGDFQL